MDLKNLDWKKPARGFGALLLHLAKCLGLALYCAVTGIIAIAIGIVSGIVLGAVAGGSNANTYVFSPLGCRDPQFGRKVAVGFWLLVIISAGYIGSKSAIVPKISRPSTTVSVAKPGKKTLRAMYFAQDEWLAGYLEDHPQCDDSELLKKAIAPYDRWFAWVAKERGYSINRIRAQAMLESGFTPDAIDHVFVSGRSSVAHIGMFQMSAGSFVRHSSALGVKASALRTLELEYWRALQAQRRGEITSATFKLQKQQFESVDPRFNTGLNTIAAGDYLGDHEKIVGSPTLAVQSFHNGLGNLAKLIGTYGEFTGKYPSFGWGDYPEILQTVESGKKRFLYPEFWYLYNSDEKFRVEIDAFGLKDDAVTYTFKVEALMRYLEKVVGNQPLDKPATDFEIAALIAAKSSSNKVAILMSQPRWLTNDLRYQRQAVTIEKQITANHYAYKNWRDLDRAQKKGKLVTIHNLPEIGLIVDDGMGQLSGVNKTYYQSVDPLLWRKVQKLAKEWRKRGGADIYATSAVRTTAYQWLMGNSSKSHPCGIALDLVLERGRPCWRWAQGRKFIAFLRANSKRWGVNFYTESNTTPPRNHVHLYLMRSPRL